MFIQVPVLLILCAALLAAQVPTIPNEPSAAFRTDLNTSLQNAASLTGSYSNPVWITSLIFAKITGVPAFVDKTIANSYAAGAKQTFQASASTAGMNFGGVASDPSTLAEGDTWYRTDLHVTRQYQNGVAVTVGATGPTGLTGATGPTGPAPATPFTAVDGGCTYLAQPEPSESCAIPYTKFTGFTGSSTGFVAFFTLPAHFSVRSCLIEVGSGFTSSGNITAMTAALGTAASPTGYGSSYAVLPMPTPPLQEWPCSGVTLATTINGSQAVGITLSVTNSAPGFLSTLTAGSLTLTLNGVVAR